MAQATYNTEEMTIVFSADMDRNDYGVQGSPVWYEPTNIEVDTVEILGVDVDPKCLPKDLIHELLAYADEIDSDDWDA